MPRAVLPNWIDFYKQSAIRVRDSEDRTLTCKQISEELVLKCAGMKDNSIKTHFKLVRRHVRELGQTILPICPREVYKRVIASESSRVAERMNDPIIIQADKLISLVVSGLRDGIERRQYPQVIFCLNYLIALRPNDLNRGHVRIGEGNAEAPQVRPGDHTVELGNFNHGGLCPGGEHTHTSELCGTLLNLNPSKFIAAKRSILAYSTVFICDVADYETVEKGIAYVQNAENAAIPCTGRVVQYKSDVPSGASTGQEWGNARKGIFKAMIERLDLNSCVTKWANHKFSFTKQLGRGFVASCVEQGRFELEPGLAPMKSVELLLGHEKLSQCNVCYLKMDVRPSKVAGVTLRKVSATSPIGPVQYGVCLTRNEQPPDEFISLPPTPLSLN